MFENDEKKALTEQGLENSEGRNYIAKLGTFNRLISQPIKPSLRLRDLT